MTSRQMVLFEPNPSGCPHRHGCPFMHPDKDTCSFYPMMCTYYWKLRRRLESLEQWQKIYRLLTVAPCPYREVCKQYKKVDDKYREERCDTLNHFEKGPPTCVEYWKQVPRELLK